MPAYGRGGAGNIEAVAQAQSRAAIDVEAQIDSGETFTRSSAPVDGSDRVQPQYAHSGRGGAGNYYSPKDLDRTGAFAGANSSHILGDGTPEPTGHLNSSTKAAQPSTIRIGRGGAGNYSFGVNESEERAAKNMIEEQSKADKLREEVEKGVQEQLAMPEKAKLSSAQS